MPWLMKAEPDMRIVKGKDVKFSVDDFEEIGTSPWDGVRSHEAKNIMRDKMKLGDKVLFYHSNCKVPGVYALAEIAQEGYPDYTAWDSSHPYYDAKSDSANPTWYMVSVKFVRRLDHPVTLALVKSLLAERAPPAGIEYIGQKGLKALQGMALVNRGRLSVQPVEDEAYEAIVALGDKGGFGSGVKPAKAAPKAKAPAKAKRAKEESDDDDDEEEVLPKKKTTSRATKAKAEPKPKTAPKPAAVGTRRSARTSK